ncbi:Spo0E like sporulation regulatory protein [Desulfitobacterium sp. LBE]|nr:Spo0E like sporulation regulatory protein [Desulfitobacterium sp. LBE]
MSNNSELKIEIEQIRHLLNTVVTDLGVNDCNYNIILDISTRMDKLILEYLENER